MKIQNEKYAGRKVRVALMKDSSSCTGFRSAGIDDAKNIGVDKAITVGDAVLCHAKISCPRNDGNPKEFDYAKWLRRQGIDGMAFCFPNQWRKSQCAGHQSLRVSALRCRDQFLKRYADYFDGQTMAVLCAMTLGDKTKLDVTTRSLFSHTGVSHILALSGLHLSILFSIYQLLINAFCRRRWSRLLMNIVGIAGLWGFALLAGLPLSLVRAAIMFTILHLMVGLRHDSLSINNLSLAALILLLLSPQSLFDVGFQLSFLSVFSILLFGRVLSCPKWLKRVRCGKWIFDLLSVSFCAQVATSPLVAYYFNTFPVVGLLANLVAVPLAYMILSLAIIFLVFPFSGFVVAPLLDTLLYVMRMSMEWLSGLPGACLEVYPSCASVVLIYVLLFGLWRYVVSRHAAWLYGTVLTLLLIVGVEFYEHRPNRLEPQLVFYSTYGAPMIHVIESAEQSYLWSTDFEKSGGALLSIKNTFWKEENIVAPQNLNSPVHTGSVYYDGFLISFGGKRVALCYNKYLRSASKEPLKVDYLLLSKGARNSIKELLEIYKPDVVVLDNSLTDYYREKYKKEISVAKIPCHDLMEDGALIVKIGNN